MAVGLRGEARWAPPGSASAQRRNPLYAGLTCVNNVDRVQCYADLMDAFKTLLTRGAVVVLLGLAVFSPSINAQTLPDVSFGGLGAGFVNLPLNQGGLDRDMGMDMKIRPDGRIVIAGSVQTATGVIAGVYQLTADGRPDPNFGGGDGRATFVDPAWPTDFLFVNALALQADGKIVLGGKRQDSAGFAMRINESGTALDAGFGDAGGVVTVIDEVRDLGIDGSGRIVVVGVIQLLSIPPLVTGDRIGVARLLANGVPDVSFDDDGTGYYSFPYGAERNYRGVALAFTFNGHLLIAAEVETDDHGLDFGVLKLLADGNADPSFGNVGLGWARVYFDLGAQACTEDRVRAIGTHHSVPFPATDRILLAGSACRADGNRDFGVARLLADGSIDDDFADNGRQMIAFDLDPGIADVATALAFQTPAGAVLGAPSHLVVAGHAARDLSQNFDLALARLRLSDGSLDSAFGNGGRYVLPLDLGGPNTELITAVATSTQRITLAGSISTSLNNGNDHDFLAVRVIADDRIFRNGFE